MAEVKNNNKVTSAIIMYAFITAKEEKDEQQQEQLQPQPQRVRRTVITTKFKDRNYRCLLFCCRSQNETH